MLSTASKKDFKSKKGRQAEPSRAEPSRAERGGGAWRSVRWKTNRAGRGEGRRVKKWDDEI